MRFLITDLGEDEIVLGYPWLAAFQPCIDWKNTTLDEKEQPLVIRTLDPSLDKEVTRICKAWIQRAEDMAEPGEEIFVWKLDSAQTRKASTSTQLAAMSRYNRSWLGLTWVVLGLSSWRRAWYHSFCLESRLARLERWLSSLAQTTLHCSSLS